MYFSDTWFRRYDFLKFAAKPVYFLNNLRRDSDVAQSYWTVPVRLDRERRPLDFMYDGRSRSGTLS